MPRVTRLVLDVLKPHEPNVVEFAMALASQWRNMDVRIRVIERDEKTETTELVVQGDELHMERIIEALTKLGGSLHSIDEVAVSSTHSRGT